MLGRLRDRLHAAPILVKILGIGALIALLFGGTTLLQAGWNMGRITDERMQQHTQSIARHLADRMTHPLVIDDPLAVAEAIVRVRERHQDLRYVLVRDHAQQLVADSFSGAVPMALLPPPPGPGLRHMSSDEGRVIEATVPLPGWPRGLVQAGFLPAPPNGEMAWFLRSISIGLIACMGVGIILAYLLAAALTRPIQALVGATRRIAEGDFSARTGCRGQDELGQLAISFDRMADVLQKQHQALVDNQRERVQLLDRVVQAQEEERLAIAQELHDHFGQTLLAILLAVESRYDDGEGDASLELNAMIAAQIRSLIEDARRLAWGIRPPVLDDYGLIAGLDRYADEIGRFSGLEVKVAHVGMVDAPRLPSRIELTLYRIAQEAISNVIRHAEASTASIVLIRRPHSVCLVIDDDGCGLPPQANADRPHLGLTGMRERARLLGGTMALESQPGEGVTLRIEIPLEETA